VDRVSGTTDRQPSLLAGVLIDAQGERMTPTHATKRGTRYRYYVSRSLLAGKAKDLGQRIPAAALEAVVTHRIRDWLADPAGVFQAVQDVTPDAGNQKRLIERTKHCAAMWQDLKPNDRRARWVRSLLASKCLPIGLISSWTEPKSPCGSWETTISRSPGQGPRRNPWVSF
jgi:hypothetical protein